MCCVQFLKIWHWNRNIFLVSVATATSKLSLVYRCSSNKNHCNEVENKFKINGAGQNKFYFSFNRKHFFNWNANIFPRIVLERSTRGFAFLCQFGACFNILYRRDMASFYMLIRDTNIRDTCYSYLSKIIIGAALKIFKAYLVK